MGTVYGEDSHRKMINKLEVDGKISKKAFRKWYMDWLFGDEIDSDSCTEGGDSSQENASDIYEKYNSATKPEG